MATQSDFSMDEWRVLRDAPQLVVVASAMAGASGLFGTLKEAIAPTGAIVEAMQGDNALLRALCDREEMKAAVSEIKDVAKTTDIRELQAYYHHQAIQKSREAVSIVTARASAEDAKAYAGFLMTLAQRVTEAASEGGFLGFGGERVSDGERVLLADLAEALGLDSDHTLEA